MDYSVFVFKRSFKHYLVSAYDSDEAWTKLSERLSCNEKKARKECELIDEMGEYSGVIKL